MLANECNEKNKRRTMTEWTVYDCAQLNHCCGPCTDDASSVKTYNKRMHDVTYQNVLLNNVFLCEKCFHSAGPYGHCQKFARLALLYKAVTLYN